MSARFAAAFAEGDARDPRRAAAPPTARRTACHARRALCQRAGRFVPAATRPRTGRSDRHRRLGRRGRARRLHRRPEVHERPAAAVLLADLPPNGFRLFGATDDPASDLPRAPLQLDRDRRAELALVHGDPRCPDLLRATVDAAGASGAFLVGGLMSHQCPDPLLAGEVGRWAGNAALFGHGRSVGAAAGLRDRRRDRADPGLLADRPGAPHRRGARQCRDDDRRSPRAGGVLRRYRPRTGADPRRLGAFVFAGLPVAGSDTGDYLVRNLMAIDPRQGWIVHRAEEVGRATRSCSAVATRQRPRRISAAC